jgi:colanic acid biosynthesis glycosyl transferase WcaI
VLQAAELLRQRADIHFLIVGEGIKKDALAHDVRSRQLSNITFLPYQPREAFAEMLAAADLSLVTLNNGAALSSLPSKIFNVMASARPILAVAPLESEIAHIVREAGCGWIIPPGCPEELAANIVQSLEQELPLIHMGQKGRIHLEKYYSRKACVDAYEKMLIALCDRAQQKPVDAVQAL